MVTVPVYLDGDRMSKISKLIDYMSRKDMQEIEISHAASVMKSNPKSAQVMIGTSKRFILSGPGTYALLPPSTLQSKQTTDDPLVTIDKDNEKKAEREERITITPEPQPQQSDISVSNIPEPVVKQQTLPGTQTKKLITKKIYLCPHCGQEVIL